MWWGIWWPVSLREEWLPLPTVARIIDCLMVYIYSFRSPKYKVSTYERTCSSWGGIGELDQNSTDSILWWMVGPFIWVELENFDVTWLPESQLHLAEVWYKLRQYLHLPAKGLPWVEKVICHKVLSVSAHFKLFLAAALIERCDHSLASHHHDWIVTPRSGNLVGQLLAQFEILR